MKKKCNVCGQIKSIDEFSRRKDTGNFRGDCNKCRLKETEKWRAKNPGYQREWQRKNPDYHKEWCKNNPDKIAKYRKEHKEYRVNYYRKRHKNNPEKRKEYYIKDKDSRRNYYREWYKKHGRKRAENYKELSSLWRKLNPEKCKNRHLVQIAIKTGKIIKPKICENCKEERKLVAHHEDYNFPLRIKWLCYSCHKILHNNKSFS